MVFRRSVADPLAKGVGDWLDNIFSGGAGTVSSGDFSSGGGWENIDWSQVIPRAAGGPVDKGMPFLVGERGRELFVPDRPGTIVPNDRLGGVSITNSGDIIVNGPGVTLADVRQALAISQRQTIAAVQEMSRR
jgi:hypothetical protein